MAERAQVDREPLRAHFTRVIGGDRALLPADDASLVDEGLLDSFGLAELVAVIEGAYGVRVPDEDISLASFESIERIAAVDVTASTAWTQNRLVFDDTPLREVADEFNRYNTRRLVIIDAELQRVGISGRYSSTDPAGLIDFLHAQPVLDVVETPDEIRVSRRIPR